MHHAGNLRNNITFDGDSFSLHGDNDSDLSIINQIEPEQDFDDFTDLDIDLDDERDYVPQRAQIDQTRLQEFLRGLRNKQMVVPPQSDAVSSVQTQVNIPGTDDPRFRLDEGLSQQILEHFTGMIQRSSRENDQRRNLSEAYKKCDRQFKKFLAQEFKEELALDTKMKNESVQALDAQGLVVKLVDGEFVRGLEYDDEFDLTTLSVRFPFEYFKRPILKSRTQIILTSSDTAKRALLRIRENQIRGSIVESKDGNIVLSFFGQVKETAFDQLSMIEISPDLETSQRVKLFIDNFPNLITSQTNQLTRNMSEYLTLDAEEFSADTWRFLLTNQRELDPANPVDIAVRSGPEVIRREIPVSKNLNVSQMQALTSCLKNNGVYLLHGPPGTGKSKTLVSLIAAYLKAGKRILVCCHTNQAVDKLLIDTHKLGILYPGLDLRIGDTGQNDRQCLQYTIRRFVSKAHKKGIIGMNGRTRDEFERSMLTNARSVFATLTGTFRTNFLRTFEGTIPFDAVIIDEASQAPLVHSMMPLMFARRLVLAGDHKQLPPCLAFQSQRMDIFGPMFGAMGGTNSTNLSPEEEAFYKQSLFERMLTKNLLKTFPRAGELSDRLKNFNPSDFLYRMNELISLASSEHFYRSQLFAHPSNQKLVLSTSEYMQRTTITQPSFIDANCPIVWIDHICPEQSDDAQKKGTKNPEEVNIVLKVLEELLFKFRIPIDKIGVITPYNAQRALFFQMLKNVTGGSTPISKFLEVSTIDSYQGREKDVIIMMATKSGGSSVGFLTEERRMNVSMTRARRLFIFVGNSNTLVYDRSRMPFTRLFFDKVVAHGQLFKFSSIDRRLTRNGLPLNGNPATSNYVYKGDAGPTMFPNLKYTLETTTTVPDYTRNHEGSWKINISRVTLPAKENNRHENRAAHGYDENSFLAQLLKMPNRDTHYPNAVMDVLNVMNGITPSNRQQAAAVLQPQSPVVSSERNSFFSGQGVQVGGNSQPPPRTPPSLSGSGSSSLSVLSNHSELLRGNFPLGAADTPRVTETALKRMFPHLLPGEETRVFMKYSPLIQRALANKTALEVELNLDPELGLKEDFLEAFIEYRIRNIKIQGHQAEAAEQELLLADAHAEGIMQIDDGDPLPQAREPLRPQPPVQQGMSDSQLLDLLEVRYRDFGLENKDLKRVLEEVLESLRDDQSIEEWRKGITSEMPFELEMTVVKAISLEHESQNKSQARVDSRVAKQTGSQVQGGAGTGARPQTTSGAHPVQQQNRGSLNVSNMTSTSMSDSSVSMDDSVDQLEEKQARIMQLRQNEQHARQPQGNFKKPKSSLLSSHAAGAPIQKPTAVSQSTQQPKQAPAPVQKPPVQTQAPRPAPVPTNNISPGHYQQAPVSAPWSQAPNPFGSTGNIPPASYQQQQPQYALGPNPTQGFPNYPIPQQAPVQNSNPFAEPEEKNHFGPLAVNPQPTNNFNPFLD